MNKLTIQEMQTQRKRYIRKAVFAVNKIDLLTKKIEKARMGKIKVPAPKGKIIKSKTWVGGRQYLLD